VWVTVLAALAVLVLGGKHLRGIGRPRAAASPPESRGAFGREA
jgi:hypothetical protein